MLEGQGKGRGHRGPPGAPGVSKSLAWPFPVLSSHGVALGAPCSPGAEGQEEGVVLEQTQGQPGAGRGSRAS